MNNPNVPKTNKWLFSRLNFSSTFRRCVNVGKAVINSTNPNAMISAINEAKKDSINN